MKFPAKVIFALFLIFPVYCSAFRNEPTGFRDLYWGQTIGELQEKRTVQYVDKTQVNSSVYSMYYLDFKEGETRVLSGVPIASDKLIAFCCDDKLWGVKIYFDENPDDWNSSFAQLRTAMVNLFGQPTEVKNTQIVQTCSWMGENTRITLSRVVNVDKTRAWCILQISSKKIYDRLYNPAANDGW